MSFAFIFLTSILKNFTEIETAIISSLIFNHFKNVREKRIFITNA